MKRRATAFAPASIGNVAVGFDLIGQSLEGAGDRVTVALGEPGVRVRAIRGVVTELPLEASANTAGRALLSLCARRPGLGLGFDIEIDKGIALSSGMGGSAASAVAALVAANALIEAPLSEAELYDLACDGEEVASGSRHGDNVAPSLYGGLVIAPSQGTPVRVPVPESVHCVVVHPHMHLATREARAALRGAYELSDFVRQSEGLALVLAGCYTKDVTLLRRGLRDVLVEPRRAPLIPGFAEVKSAALATGAIGASISGAGPSVFAWVEGEAAARRTGEAMARAFAAANLVTDVHVSTASGPGARLVP